MSDVTKRTLSNAGHYTAMVTGAGGFIGQHLIEQILDTTDWDVVAVDRQFPSAPRHDRVRRVRSTLRTKTELPSVDVVFSLAADVDVKKSLRLPAATIENNVGIANTIVDFARHQDTPPLIVHLTTAEVFGPGGPHGLHEPPRPTNPYAASKAAQDAIFHAAGPAYGLRVVTARTANVFGEHQSADKFIPTVVRRVLADEMVELFGDAWRRWIHANDVANELITLAKNGGPAQANVTGSKLIRNADIVSAIAHQLGHKATVNDDGAQRPGHEDVYDVPPINTLGGDDAMRALEQVVKVLAS